MGRRAAGLLLHPTSLPGRFGIGDLGPAADSFCDWAARAGQGVWQVLPMGPTDGSGSPYSVLSAFAGNPLLVSPERLREDGLLPAGALQDAPGFPERRVQFAAVSPWKERLLRTSWEHFERNASAELRRDLDAFRAGADQAGWLEDWALYAALRARSGGRPWTEWDTDLKRREARALAVARRELAGEIAFHAYVQFLFFWQWARLKHGAERRGIRIVGDVPMYMAHDSADVWVDRRLFTVDDGGRLESVAGVPPDYFSATGQLWGNPLYRWDRLEGEGFAWWLARLRASLKLAHLVRLDHFRGFAGYWEVKASERTAANGRWVPGPGARFFEAARREIGALPFIAEDLGVITPEIRELRDAFSLPGMKVLQFAFGDADSEHLPHHHVPRCVVYTGTHDNDTARGWFARIGSEERARVLDYLGTDGRSIEWDLLRTAYASVAELAVVPVQDVFSLGSEARMNVPGGPEGHWTWRAEAGHFGDDRAGRLERLGELTGRLHEVGP